MADVLVTPAFQSAIADSGDVTKLGPNAWNAARLFAGGVTGGVLVRDSASTTGASWMEKHVEFTKLVTAIPDAVATSVLTVTVPNASHVALINIEVVVSLGAGGAIGAFEAAAGGRFDITVTRTAGVVAAMSGASLAEPTGSATCVGAATCTLARGIGSVSGGAGATNTVPITVTITRGSGSSTNHQALLHVTVLNSNANGITVS